MTWAAAGGDTGGHGSAQAQIGAGGKRVEVWGVRGFELGSAKGLHWEASKSVQDEQDDPGIRRDRQFAHEVKVQVGSSPSLYRRLAARKKSSREGLYNSRFGAREGCAERAFGSGLMKIETIDLDFMGTEEIIA